jgi:hypothetical protein
MEKEKHTISYLYSDASEEVQLFTCQLTEMAVVDIG